MKIVEEYSFNNGKEKISVEHQQELNEIRDVIARVNAGECLTKKSKEKTKKGQMLYAPTELNKRFATEFRKFNWDKEKIPCEYKNLDKQSKELTKIAESLISELNSNVHTLTEIKNIAINHVEKINTELFRPISVNQLLKKLRHEEYIYKVKRTEWLMSQIEADELIQIMTPDFVGFREMDFIKNKLGVEVQFGKYAFMVYNVCAKMTIFAKKKLIHNGVEIVPVKRLQRNMSTGVSFYEQFVWDLDNRGTADIDIPVLIIGVDV